MAMTLFKIVFREIQLLSEYFYLLFSDAEIQLLDMYLILFCISALKKFLILNSGKPKL